MSVNPGKNPIRCENCGVPVVKDCYRNVDSDGPYCEGDWVVCKVCLPNATLGDDCLRACLKQALVSMHETLGLRIKNLRGVRFMTRKEVWSIRRRKTVVEGLPNYCSLGIANTNAVIVLRPGIHLDTALVTMAHELAHIWQFENWPCFGLLEKWQLEGFAEWVAYKVALSQGLITEAEGLIFNPDQIYGGGLRKVLEIEKAKGHAFVMSGMAF